MCVLGSRTLNEYDDDDDGLIVIAAVPQINVIVIDKLTVEKFTLFDYKFGMHDN